MALMLSTGLRNRLLDTNSMKSALQGFVIKVYSGTVPVTADAALIGGDNYLLLTLSDNGSGGGLSFNATASGGALSKLTSQTWSGTCATGGTATFYRFQASADDNTLSTITLRLQGTAGAAGSDLVLPSATLTLSQSYSLGSYAIGIPPY
jgi:hypothetical protein